MTLLSELYRLFCLCIIEKQSWAPSQDQKIPKPSHKARMQMLKSKKKPYLSKPEISKPAWLKEWTISKGWVHNRSHMLSLGMDKDDKGDSTNVKVKSQSDSSSVSDVDELISVISVDEQDCEVGEVLEASNIHAANQEEVKNHDSQVQKYPNQISGLEQNSADKIFDQIFQNYRENFKRDQPPRRPFDDIHLPVIYKEKLLEQTLKEESFLKHIWKNLKEITSKRSLSNCKFTSNELYEVNREDLIGVSLAAKDSWTPKPTISSVQDHPQVVGLTKKKTSLGKNLALFNTLNAKSNIHEDTILECSDESNLNSLSYIYYNPVYVPTEPKYFDFYSRHHKDTQFYNFGDSVSPQKHPVKQFPDLTSHKKSNQQLVPYKPSQISKYSRNHDKYIIRHVRVRIMLSLRIGKKIKRKNSVRRTKRKCKKEESDGDEWHHMRKQISTMHEEQRRIGNGRTSIKIQNMRHGRLNVLRWLLWEADSTQEGSTVGSGTCSMPALQKGGSSEAGESHGVPNGNATLALHYAAARGCLDCVRLLVDSSADLSANTQMDNDVTPVYLAAQEGHLEVLKFLVLEAGGSLYVRAKDGMAPIHAASQMGCLNCVKWMIQEQGVDPNLRDGDGATPLHFAASRGHLETVRWLLKHGARLSLDKYGKSPINDAAENQQVECLNVLVQHGTTPDYNDSDKSSNGKRCSCTGRKDPIKRGNSTGSDCSNCKPRPASKNSKNTTLNPLEPFYLHPPLNGRSLEPAHAPENGLYINPMVNHRHSTSTCSDSSSIGSESFYLHNPNEIGKEHVYNRVKDLFDSSGDQSRSISALKVKVEVHSSSSGAGSDENLSSSDLSSVKSNDHENDYEDIYLVREEARNQDRVNGHPVNGRSRSRDSGSHSRSGSVSSSNSGCNVIVKMTPTSKGVNKDKNGSIYKSNEFLPKPQKLEKSEKKLNGGGDNERAKKVLSAPVETTPPPPPPPPPNNPNKHLSLVDPNDPHLSEPRGAEIVEVVEEPTLRPSDIVKGMCRSMSALSARRLNSSCSDLTIVSLTEEDRQSTANPTITAPANRQRVLPFVPPSFPVADPNKLIKPSEYLRSISGGEKRSDISIENSNGVEEKQNPEEVVVEVKEEITVVGPPPPPLPEFNGDLTQSTPSKQNTLAHQEKVKKMQPLSAISIQDLNSVQLRRTEKISASKTFSAPTRSVSLQCLNTADPFMSQKTDLIAELKMSKDLTGLKKMKIEKAKTEQTLEREVIFEIKKQFTATNFVEKIPDKDNTGNMIPAWKRQMLAKKAAEKAKKELEEQMQREAEERRLQSIPQWKRQLIAKKEETEHKIRQTIYTPKVIEEPKVKLHDLRQQIPSDDKINEDFNNNQIVHDNKDMSLSNNSLDDDEPSDEESNIIPWRAQLRKTNSSLNLLC